MPGPSLAPGGSNPKATAGGVKHVVLEPNKEEAADGEFEKVDNVFVCCKNAPSHVIQTFGAKCFLLVTTKFVRRKSYFLILYVITIF